MARKKIALVGAGQIGGTQGAGLHQFGHGSVLVEEALELTKEGR